MEPPRTQRQNAPARPPSSGPTPSAYSRFRRTLPPPRGAAGVRAPRPREQMSPPRCVRRRPRTAPAGPRCAVTWPHFDSAGQREGRGTGGRARAVARPARVAVRAEQRACGRSDESHREPESPRPVARGGRSARRRGVPGRPRSPVRAKPPGVLGGGPWEGAGLGARGGLPHHASPWLRRTNRRRTERRTPPSRPNSARSIAASNHAPLCSNGPHALKRPTTFPLPPAQRPRPSVVPPPPYRGPGPAPRIPEIPSVSLDRRRDVER